jgi:hypothetical protein
MSEIKNPRIHPEILSVLAVLLAPMNKILTINPVTSQGHLTRSPQSCRSKYVPLFATTSPVKSILSAGARHEGGENMLTLRMIDLSGLPTTAGPCAPISCHRESAPRVFRLAEISKG